MKNKIFIIIILVCTLISKPSFSLFHSFNLDKTDCVKNFMDGKFYEATPLCLDLIKEMEDENYYGEDYVGMIYIAGISALRSADYKIVKNLFDKLFNYVEKNQDEDYLYYEIHAVIFYASFLIEHKVNINLADKLLKKYMPIAKKQPIEFFGDQRMKDQSIILLEITSTEVMLKNNHNNNFQEIRNIDYINQIKTLNNLVPKLKQIEEYKSGNINVDKAHYSFRLKLNLALADLHSQIEQFDLAEKYILENISIVNEYDLPEFTKSNHYMEAGFFYNNIAIFSEDIEDHNKTIKYLTKALEYIEKNPLMKKEPAYGSVLDTIAYAYWFLNKTEEGYKYSKQAAELSLSRLYQKVSQDILFSDSYELEMAKERFKTHHALLQNIYFNRLYNNEPTYDIAIESFENGQLLPSLETAQALAHLKYNIGEKNEDLSSLYKNKKKLEKIIMDLETQIDFLRADKNSDKSKINKSRNLLLEYDKKLSETNAILDQNFPNYKGFGINQIKIYETWMALNPNEAIFIFYQPYKTLDVQNTYDEFMIHGWFVTQEYVTPLHIMNINKEKFYLLKDHLNFSNNIFQYSQFPFEVSYELYEILFKNILEVPNLREQLKNIDHLIIINDGILYQLPYWVLITTPPKKNKEIKDQSWISKNYAITTSPSLHTFVTLRGLSKKNIGIKFSSRTDIPDFDMGIIIDQVFNNTPAKKIGLKKQDIIIAINNEKIQSPLQLVDVPKDKKIELLIIRNNKKISFSIPPIIENKNFDLEFVGIGNPSGLKNSTFELVSATPIKSINEIFSDIDTNTRGVNKRFIEEMPALPGTERELKEIANYFDNERVNLFLGDQASETVVKNLDISNTKYLSFASHAVIKGELGKFDEPGIILSPPDISSEENDGLLTASEIAELKIGSDLVILSACNTAAGIDGDITSEGLTGLAKSFFYAGATELLVSNWRVTDDYAARLTTGMFDYITKKENATKAEALQYSINELINENLHPIFWAPFMLVGDGL